MQAHAQSHTSKEKPTKLTVLAAGDIADCRKTPAAQSKAVQTALLVEAVLQKDPDAKVLTLGDNTYPIGKPEEFSECYDPTWGKFKASTLPSPGNHDYGVPMAAGYYNYFDELAGPDRRGYYRKSLGAWSFYSLNSNLSGVAMQDQISWLQAELQKNKTACALAYWHHPVFSSGGHGNNDVMQSVWKLLSAAKFDIVLTSHDHDYERISPLDSNGNRDDKNGLRSFVVGTGGTSLTPMFFAKDFSEIRNNDTHGVLKLDLQSKSYNWEFLPIAGQTFTDHGRGDCHVK